MLKFAAKVITDQIKGNEWEIIPHTTNNYGRVVLKGQDQAICPVELCSCCNCWVPTLSNHRTEIPAYTHKTDWSPDANGTMIRQILPGSERMVCFECYQFASKHKTLPFNPPHAPAPDAPKRIEPTREIPDPRPLATDLFEE